MVVSGWIAQSGVLIVLAALLQLLAAVFALRLIRVTGMSMAWVLIAGGFCAQAVRRFIALGRLLSGDPLGAPDLWDDSLALMISIIMLAGVVAIPPLFYTIQRAADTLRRAKEELEIKVAERTVELRDANVQLSVELDERRRAEMRLAQYAAELKRSNAELEQFAYVASHDLQEPLRMVASFTQLLARRYRGKLDQDANEFIDFAVDGANRMQSLIQDLLVYSRVGTRGKDFAPTDCNAILNQALVDLTAAMQESGATLTHDPLPTVMGDEVQLGQLFQNLIANALKFRSVRPPVIHISAKPNRGGWLFSCRDNGIGVAPEHRERIFAVFQRLHSRAEYPGTGIGLALCKKIVERHGGRIWVESEPGKGATFYFTIPGGEAQ